MFAIKQEKNYNYPVNKGFTLVELSIVLVIVGLLIGGILVGQSLIDAARVNRLASDLGQYEIAIAQFKDRFRQIPGDSDLFTPRGDADLQIGFINNGFSNPDPESRNAWAHLSQAKMLSTDYEVYDSNVHGNYFTQSNAGVIWPNTIIDVAGFQSAIGLAGNKAPIAIRKNRSSANLSISINLNPLDSLSLESKLGSTTGSHSPGNNRYSQVGLFNPSGVGRCKGTANFSGGFSGTSSGGPGYDCITGSGRGRLHYLIAP